MCGIAGIQFKRDVPREGDTARLDQAAAHFAESLHHRGPDHVGLHRTPRAVFANLRLAIVDRAGGQQPIHGQGAHARRGIVYNGEVYNHEALRPGLEGTHAFRTHSDTEVVLATVLAHGPAGLALLDGMFGLCVWDDADASFLLARDRFGMKPLYVYEDDECIAFASELRTLLGLPGLDHGLDPVGFQDYLAYRYNLAPHTMFRRIRKLPAGCVLRFGGRASQTSRIDRYAEPQVHETAAARPEGELLEELDALLTAAVRSQLMGEVPIGLTLSGGLDSSTIAAYVHRAGAQLRAYSIGFPEINEFVYSRAVAQHFGLPYTEVVLTQDELRRGMDGVFARMDEPIADPACFALSRLCEDIRRDVTVVLSGEGGDELFAGYAHHELGLQPGLSRDDAFAQFFHRSANNIEANQWLRDKGAPLAHLRWRGAFDDADTLLSGMQQFELRTWLPENLMMKADKVLMAHSLEGRFPFLDLNLVRFATALPAAAKLPRAGAGKHLLRQLVTPKLPSAVVMRRKMGFTVPPGFFLQALQARLAGAIAALRGTEVAEVLDLDAIEALFARLYRGESMPVFKPWNIAVLLLWWSEVYPGLKAKAGQETKAQRVEAIRPAAPAAEAAPAATPETVRRRLVVYTALVGAKEALANPLEDLPPGAATDLELEFVCVTDQPQLASPVWRMLPIGDRHLPAEKLSRRPKAMPHAYFPDAQFSLYVDNTVRFKRLPQSSDLATARPYLFRAFRHATRQHPGEEAGAIAMLAYDDVDTICTQMDFYAARRDLKTLTPLTTGTVLLREHHAEPVRRFGTLWWESILAFSKRDQLSIDFALHESGAAIEHWPGNTRDNDLLVWNGSLASHRLKASFDAKRYAWRHRADPAARADPRAHCLAHAREGDTPYLQRPRMLEYACHETGSSLGSQVVPRRGMADALQTLIESWRRAGVNFLMLRVQGATGPRAFDAGELDAAAQAIAMVLAPAAGATMDVRPADLLPDGRVFVPPAEPFDLVLVLGAAGSELPVLVPKLRRLVQPGAGALALVLRTPASLAHAAEVERWLAQQFGAPVLGTVAPSQHDDDGAVVPNTVLGFAWSGGTTPAAPAPTVQPEVVSA